MVEAAVWLKLGSSPEEVVGEFLHPRRCVSKNGGDKEGYQGIDVADHPVPG